MMCSNNTLKLSCAQATGPRTSLEDFTVPLDPIVTAPNLSTSRKLSKKL